MLSNGHQLRPKPRWHAWSCNLRNYHVSLLQQNPSPVTDDPSNNAVASAISTLGLDASESRSLLTSPQAYLSKQSAENASHIRSVLIPAYQTGFRIIFLIGSSLAALAFVLAWGLMPQIGLKRSDDEALKEEGKKRANGELDEETRG